MSLEIQQKGIVVAGGFTYKCEETGESFKHPHLSVLEDIAKKHLRANNLPIPAGWHEQFEENVCRNSPNAVCRDTAAPSIVDKALSLSKALAKWAVEGFPVVPQEIYNQREAICLQCPHHTEKKGVYTGCKICGCRKQKIALSTSKCPDNPPRWFNLK